MFSYEDYCFFFLHQDLYKTAIEFLKLEKIELGGVRGNILGSMVTQIYDEVFELVKVFAECKYDPLDPGDSVSRGGPLGWTHVRCPRSGETCGGSVGHVLKTSQKLTAPGAVPITMSILRWSPETCRQGWGRGRGQSKHHPRFAC